MAPNIIAFAGASRVGKTTLMDAIHCELLADENLSKVVRVYRSELQEWTKELGFDAQNYAPLEDRLRIQEHLATKYVAKMEELKAQPYVYLCDRSWADLWAYMLADVPRDITPEQDARVQALYTKLYPLGFDQSIIVIPRGIPLAPPQPGKANATHSYQQHIEGLICTELFNVKDILGPERGQGWPIECCYLHNEVVDLHERVKVLLPVVKGFIQERLSDAQE